MANDKEKIIKELPFEITIDYELYEKAGVPDLPQLRGVQVGPKKYYFNPLFKKCALDFYNFEARSDDVYILGMMRSGTTFIGELIYLLVNDLNFQAASRDDIVDRVPTIETYLIAKTLVGHKAQFKFGPLKIDANSILRNFTKRINVMKTRRCIRSHLPISLLSPHIFNSGAKIIYCARNPKDIIVSNYHFYRLFQEESFESFTDFFKMFKLNALPYLPYFEHIKEAWAMRNNPNFMFLFYEDILKDKRKTYRDIANFIKIDVSDEGLNKIYDHLDINQFKKNKSVNMVNLQNVGVLSKNESFVRKGETGDWRNYFTGDLEKEVNDWIEENLKGTDIAFPYE